MGGTLCWGPWACRSECDPGPGPQAAGRAGTGRSCSSPAGPGQQSLGAPGSSARGRGGGPAFTGTAPSTAPQVGGSRGGGCAQTCSAADAPSTIRKQIQALPPVPSHGVRIRLPTTFKSNLPPQARRCGDRQSPLFLPQSQASDQQVPKAPPPADLEFAHLPGGLEPPSAGASVSLLPPSRPTTRPRPAFILPGACSPAVCVSYLCFS